MNAVEFLKEADRMHNFNDQDCAGCEINKRRGDNLSCVNWVLNHPDEAVEIVERWGKDHPRKTRQSEFLGQFSKMFPRMNQANGWWRDICPKDIDTKMKCPVCANGMIIHCTDCRENYWLFNEEENNG